MLHNFVSNVGWLLWSKCGHKMRLNNRNWLYIPLKVNFEYSNNFLRCYSLLLSMETVNEYILFLLYSFPIRVALQTGPIGRGGRRRRAIWLRPQVQKGLKLKGCLDFKTSWWWDYLPQKNILWTLSCIASQRNFFKKYSNLYSLGCFLTLPSHCQFSCIIVVNN